MNSLAPHVTLPEGAPAAPCSPPHSLCQAKPQPPQEGSEHRANYTQQVVADWSACLSALSHSRKNLGKLTGTQTSQQAFKNINRLKQSGQRGKFM